MCISKCWKKSMSYVENKTASVPCNLNDANFYTSLEVKETIIPTVPDNVVYTINSEPPGIKVVLCSECMVSPT